MSNIAKRMMMLVIICLFAGITTSCSIVRLGYNYGETLSYWWLDSYVDFDTSQKVWFKERVATWFAWHRKTQLRDYVSLLGQEQKKLQHKVTPAELLIEYEGLRTRAVLLVDRALPELADLALSLQSAQIDHIQKKITSSNESYRKDYLRGDTGHRQQFRYKKLMEQAEYWFGSFSSEQEALIRKASDARPLNNELRMAVRLQQQQNLIQLLKKIHTEKPAHDAVVSMLKEYFHNIVENYGGMEHQAFFAVSRDDTAGLAAVIINGTTQKQKEHAIKRLQQWIDNFSTLSTQAA